MKSMGMGCEVFIEPSSQHQTINEPPEAKYQTCSFATANLANSIQAYSYDTFHNTNYLVESAHNPFNFNDVSE